MKIVITGSLGNISKPLTIALIQKKHQVIVISSNIEKQKDIEALGAFAAIGSIEDVDFLTKTFTGADIVYCMTPPLFSKTDQIAYYRNLAIGYAKAIEAAKVKKGIYLSSYGAHLEKGTGYIAGSYHAEKVFNTLSNVTFTYIRPGYFYYNLFHFIGAIKYLGFIATNYGANDKLLMVSPYEIAMAIVEEIENNKPHSSVRYVASDDRTCNEVAQVLGNSIGIPTLEWKIISSEQMNSNLVNNGLPLENAQMLVELGEATHSGVLRELYDQEKPPLGKIKIEDFAEEFSLTFKS